MLLLVVLIVVLVLLFAGRGVMPYGPGLNNVLLTVVAILLILWLLGALR